MKKTGICPIHDEPMRIRRIGREFELYCPLCEEVERKIKHRQVLKDKKRQGKLL